MERRKFISRLFGSAVVAGSASAFARARNPKTLLVQKTRINGMAYYDIHQVVEQMSLNDKLTLKREPDNKHDCKAVEVYWRDHKLGYVPRISNFALAKMLDDGENITAKVVKLNAEDLPWAGVAIEIFWRGM